MRTFVAAILFLPACLIGFLVDCSRAGFDTGVEIAEEESDGKS